MNDFRLTAPTSDRSAADFNLRAPDPLPLPSRSPQPAAPAASAAAETLRLGDRAAAGLRRPNLQEDLFTQQRRLF